MRCSFNRGLFELGMNEEPTFLIESFTNSLFTQSVMVFVVFVKILCWIAVVWTGHFALGKVSSGSKLDGVERAVACLEGVETLYFRNDLAEAANVITLWDESRRLNDAASEILKRYLGLLWSPERILHQTNPVSQTQIIGSRLQRKLIQKSNFLKTNFYVLIVDSHKELQNIIGHIHHYSKIRIETRFLILVHTSLRGTDAAHLVTDTLDMLYSQYRISNVVILVNGAVAIDQFDLYANHPLRYCNIIKHIKIGDCVGGRLTYSQGLTEFLMHRESMVPLYVEKCNLTLCARAYEPFVGAGCDQGMEIEVVNIVMNALQLKMMTECGDIGRWEVLKGQQEEHIFQTLMENNCDILLGGFYPSPKESQVFERSTFYLENSHTWFVAMASTRPRWEGLLYIFNSAVWIGIGCTLGMSTLFWMGLERVIGGREKVSLGKALFSNWALFLGNSLPSRPVRVSHRIFFLFLAFFGFCVSTFYTENLIRTFTQPQVEKQIDTIEEILAARIPIGGLSGYLTWFNTNSDVDRRVFEAYRISDNFIPSDQSLDAVRLGRQALLTSRLFVRSNRHRKHVHGITGDVFKNQLEMMMSKGFPLVQQVNLVLHYMLETGLIDKIVEDYQFNMSKLLYIQSVVNGTLEATTDNDKIVLTVDHLQSAFAMYAIGIGVSCFIFALEFFTRIFK